MLTHRGGDVTTKSMRGLYLPDAANIIVLPLDRLGHLAPCQAMMHKYRINCLQEQFRGQVHYSEIFVIECPVNARCFWTGLLIATHEVKEELLVASDMAIEIHAHETRKLDETGINVPQEARVRVQKRHLSNEVGGTIRCRVAR